MTCSIRAICIAVLCGSVAHAQPKTTFLRRADLTPGAAPIAVTAADLDGDGYSDLVVANYDSSDVSIFWGNGDGTFVSAAAALPVGVAGTEAPLAIVVAEVTGDGRPDILTVNQFANTVSVLPNRGQRAFGPAIESPTGGSPEGVVVVDVNGDHVLDVVTANFLDDTVTVLIGRGDGSFGFASVCSNQTTRICRVNSDCATAANCTPQPVPVGAAPKALAAADLNNDGLVDLIVALAISSDAHFVSSVMVLRGLGDGHFVAQPEVNSPTFDFGSAVAVVVADVNGDGNGDMVVSNEAGDSLSVLMGKGDLTFQGAGALSGGAGSGPRGVLVADVNGDGAKDIATSASFQDKVSMFAGLGNGTFAAPQDFALAAGALPFGLALGDFNRDSRVDLVTANMENNTVALLVNPCAGDCGLNGWVTVDEVLALVNVAVGNGPIAACLAGDTNGDGQITVDEILMAVQSAMSGCSA